MDVLALLPSTIKCMLFVPGFSCMVACVNCLCNINYYTGVFKNFVLKYLYVLDSSFLDDVNETHSDDESVLPEVCRFLKVQKNIL